MRFREVERILLQDGWQIKAQVGSHRQYVHPHKQGKVTVPNHRGDLPPAVVKAIWKQAGIREGARNEADVPGHSRTL